MNRTLYVINLTNLSRILLLWRDILLVHMFCVIYNIYLQLSIYYSLAVLITFFYYRYYFSVLFIYYIINAGLPPDYYTPSTIKNNKY